MKPGDQNDDQTGSLCLLCQVHEPLSAESIHPLNVIHEENYQRSIARGKNQLVQRMKHSLSNHVERQGRHDCDRVGHTQQITQCVRIPRFQPVPAATSRHFLLDHLSRVFDLDATDSSDQFG